MNSDQRHTDAPVHDDAPLTFSEQERREAIVTAYALGDLDAAGGADVERLLADPTQGAAREQVAAVRVIAAALKRGVGDESPTRSAGLRQAVLAAVTHPQPSRRRTVRRSWMLLSAAIAASLLVAFLRPMTHSTTPPVRERLVAENRKAAAPPSAAAWEPAAAAPVTTAPGAPAPADARLASTELQASAATQMTSADDHNGVRRAVREDEKAKQPARASERSQAAHARSTRDSGSLDLRTPAGREGNATITDDRPGSPLEHPLFTFPVNVDKGSSANVRRFLDSGRLPPREAVRIGELLNDFPYDYPQPEGDLPFSVTVDAAECPWNHGRRLVRIGLRGRAVDHDTPQVPVERHSGSTVTIAEDVKIRVEFNPLQVRSYRPLGYENGVLDTRHFPGDTKDAGEIGAGHRVTALYEVVLADERADGDGRASLQDQPQAELEKSAADAAIDPAVSRDLLTVKLRWRLPAEGESAGLEVPLSDRGPAFADAPADLRFAAAVAAFGMILRDSDQKGDASLPMVATIAGGALGRDEGGYRAEFLDLVRKAESLRGR